MNESYLPSAIRQFRYYKNLADKAMAQLSPEQLFATSNQATNSIAVIVQHLAGNMLSRWTDFLEADGEKPWRDRDAEFELHLRTPEALQALWEKGWACLFEALEPLQESDLGRIVYIRNEGHTVLDAIMRQLAHYPYHVGQIVFYAKQLKTASWDTLSIGRNQSQNYNQDKFAQDKGIRHFTDGEFSTIAANPQDKNRT